ncbi:MAG: hypothetical protein LKJ86_01675 [Oscillibacter sp.]|nr:hypothetical protein [Oscillibacter sp.]
MYNRYIRNDRGTYTRVVEEDADGTHPGAASETRQNQPEQEPRQPDDAPPPFSPFPLFGEPSHGADTVTHALRKLLDRFHLDNIDTGDLLLLLLLFLLFEEDADEELLIALGLLLIL